MTFKDCKNAGSCGKTLCLPEYCHEFERIQNADIKRKMIAKLIELLDVACTVANNICGGVPCEECEGRGKNGCTLYHVADHLIANITTIATDNEVEALKRQLVVLCREKFDYYDIVDECSEMVDYGSIIDFLFYSLAEMITGREEDGK